MKELIVKIFDNFKLEIDKLTNIIELEKIKILYLSKNSELNKIAKNINKLTLNEKKEIGSYINIIKKKMYDIIINKKNHIYNTTLESEMMNEYIDMTLPGEKKISIGSQHPINKVLKQIINIFLELGFSLVDGPEIETTYYNFDALNINKNHPSRNINDTFYINDKFLLRTQTSPVQIRVMEKNKPPIKIISFGKTYRKDTIDNTHLPCFHQLEGLLINKKVSMNDLKIVLLNFAEKFYGNKVKLRFRPHYFPFTEPSAEIDIMCFSCLGKGCKFCKYEGYIEILGCGIVNPKVIKNAGLDPKQYTGYAFGIGIERIAMQKFQINDIRLFYENDIRFLHQF